MFSEVSALHYPVMSSLLWKPEQNNRKKLIQLVRYPAFPKNSLYKDQEQQVYSHKNVFIVGIHQLHHKNLELA